MYNETGKSQPPKDSSKRRRIEDKDIHNHSQNQSSHKARHDHLRHLNISEDQFLHEVQSDIKNYNDSISIQKLQGEHKSIAQGTIDISQDQPDSTNSDQLLNQLKDDLQLLTFLEKKKNDSSSPEERELYNKACTVIGMIQGRNPIIRERGIKAYKELQKNSTDTNNKKILEKIQEAIEAPRPAELTDICFGNQTLAEIFPKMNLDHITDLAKKHAYIDILKDYAQALHYKAQETFQSDQSCQDVLRHYDLSQIYYKWYGHKELTQLITVRDTRDGTISIGPSKGLLQRQFGTDTNRTNVYEHINIQEACKLLQEGKIKVQYATHMVLRPIYKQNIECDGKIGPIGLYLTDNYTQLGLNYGWNSSDISRLYSNSSVIPPANGLWVLPEGAVKMEVYINRGKKPTHSIVERW